MTDPIAIALESFRLIETGEVELAQRIIAPDYVNAEADDDPDDAGPQLPGPPGFLATSQWLRDAFSDLRFELHETVAEEGVVMAAATITGEHRERSTASNPPASGSATSRCISSRSLVAGSPVTAPSVTTWACCYNSVGAPAAGDVAAAGLPVKVNSLVSLWFQQSLGRAFLSVGRASLAEGSPFLFFTNRSWARERCR
jgi:hypothetical protein